MHFNFFPSLFIALLGLLMSVDALPKPLNMQGTPSLTPSITPSISPSPSPSVTPLSSSAPSFTPSTIPSTSSSLVLSSTITASPTLKHKPFAAGSSTSTSTSATATALTAADLNLFSTVTGLLGALASLLGLA